MAVINHYESGGPALDAESVAEVRAHWDGLFQFGGPDVQVINVTKDAIWSRQAALPENAAPAIDGSALVRAARRRPPRNHGNANTEAPT